MVVQMEYVTGGENSLCKAPLVGGSKIAKQRWLELKEQRGSWLKVQLE